MRASYALRCSLPPLAEKYNQAVADIAQLWSSSSRERVTEELQQYAAWLTEIGQVAKNANNALSEWEMSFEKIYSWLVKSACFRENSAQRYALLEANVAGMHDAELARLETEYNEWEAKNTQLALDYYAESMVFASQVPDWPNLPNGQLPVPGSIKRAAYDR